MTTETLRRLDSNPELRERLLQYCRLKKGEVWEDPEGRHRVGVLDAAKKEDLELLFDGRNADLMVNDPPYNFSVGGRNTSALSAQSLDRYIAFSKAWVMNAIEVLGPNAHFYIWLGADQKNGFQPLPDFMLMMREFTALKSRSFITLRNQRGYGTQKNWMAVRQELLYYMKGEPEFTPQYTDIPKKTSGYYKKVDGEVQENLERSKSDTIRPGNVWYDIQQVFYKMQENVAPCNAQKPLAAIERILEASSDEGDLVIDF